MALISLVLQNAFQKPWRKIEKNPRRPLANPNYSAYFKKLIYAIIVARHFRKAETQ